MKENRKISIVMIIITVISRRIRIIMIRTVKGINSKDSWMMRMMMKKGKMIMIRIKIMEKNEMNRRRKMRVSKEYGEIMEIIYWQICIWLRIKRKK